MKKNLKYIILPIICIVVVGITFFLLFDLKNKVEEKNYGVGDIEVVENDNNTENEIEENTIENNEVEENTTKEENSALNNTVENTLVESSEEKLQTATTIYEDNTDAGSTNKKEEAINLVKQKWGEDDTVVFRCDSVLSNGEYVVAVISKSTASVKNYFRVNLDKKTAEVDF